MTDWGLTPIRRFLHVIHLSHGIVVVQHLLLDAILGSTYVIRIDVCDYGTVDCITVLTVIILIMLLKLIQRLSIRSCMCQRMHN